MKETCVFCDRPIPGKRMTNGDRIRAMSDEELALTIMCPNDAGLAEIECAPLDENGCAQCTLDWLQEKETDNMGSCR